MINKEIVMKYIVRGILSLFIVAVAFFSFLVSTAKKNEVLLEKSFLASVNDFAVSDDSIYTLDTTYHTICKYDLKGNFLFAITYSSFGGGRIFIQDNRLCRYDYRSDKVYVYDDAGGILEIFDKDISELIEEDKIKRSTPVSIEHNGKTYNLQKRFILNSELTFESTVIVVESWAYHLTVCLVILLCISLFAFAIYNIVRSCINNWNTNKGFHI